MTTDSKAHLLLRFERENRGWSQRVVADKLGTTKENVSCWERGVRLPGKYYQEKLCELFNKTATELGFLAAEKQVLPASSLESMVSSPDQQTLTILERTGETILVTIAIPSTDVLALLQFMPHESSHTSSTFSNLVSSSFQRASPQMWRSSSPSDSNTQGIIKKDMNSELEGEDMDTQRRKIIQQGIGLVGTVTMFPFVGYQDLNADALRVLKQHSSGPGEREMRQLEQKIVLYWQARYQTTLAPVDLISHVAGYVQEVIALLDHSLLPSIRTRLCVCLSQGALLIGACFHDLGQFQTARAYYQTAEASAHEANQTTLHALAWRYSAYTWLRSHEPDWEKQALDCMQQASSLASLGSDSTAQCFISAGLATVYTYSNEKGACLRELERASKVNDHGDWYFLHQFDQSGFSGYQGRCLQQFYQPDAPDTHSLVEESRQALEIELSHPNVNVLRKAFCRADLAQVYARIGEVEVACEHASQSLNAAQTSAVLRQQLVTVRTLLEPHTDVAVVKDLNEQMRTFSFVVS